MAVAVPVLFFRVSFVVTKHHMKIGLRKKLPFAGHTSMEEIRITPPDGQPVCIVLTHLSCRSPARRQRGQCGIVSGLPVKVLTTFVKGSPIAQFIKDNLKSRHMDYEGVEVPQGGPWGYRHQFNIADSGCRSRGPRVWNDRAAKLAGR